MTIQYERREFYQATERYRTPEEVKEHVLYSASMYIELIKVSFPEIFRFLPGDYEEKYSPNPWYAISKEMAEAVKRIGYRYLVYFPNNNTYFLLVHGSWWNDGSLHKNHIIIQLLEEVERERSARSGSMYNDDPKAPELQPKEYVPELPIRQIQDTSFLAGYHYGLSGEISPEKALKLFNSDDSVSLPDRLIIAAEYRRQKAKQKEYEATEREFSVSEPEKLTWFERIFGRRI